MQGRCRAMNHHADPWEEHRWLCRLGQNGHRAPPTSSSKTAAAIDPNVVLRQIMQKRRRIDDDGHRWIYCKDCLWLDRDDEQRQSAINRRALSFHKLSLLWQHQARNFQRVGMLTRFVPQLFSRRG